MRLTLGNIVEEVLKLRRRIKELENSGGISIPEESFDSNTEAVEQLGLGKLYKSSTLVNGSPIILITV